MLHSFPYWRLSGFYFFYFAFIGAFAPYWSLYLQSLDFNAFQIGVLMSLLQVMRIFAPAAWGWLADHTRRPLVIVQLSAVLCLISYAGVFLGSGFFWMFVVMALMSFFWSASLPLVEATTLSHLGESPARYGHIRLWGSIGFIVAVIGIGYVLDAASIRTLLWLVLGSLIGITLFAGYIPDAQALSHDTDLLPVGEILRRPEVIALFAACFLMAAAHGPYYTFYSIYLAGHDYSKSSIGWLWAIGVICEIAVFILMPGLMRKFALKQLLVTSFILAVLRFLVIGWGVGWAGLIVFAQTLHAATFGAYHACAVALVHHFFRGRHAPKGQALYTSLTFGAGGAFGGLYSGYAWDALGASVTFSIGAGCALAGLLLVLWKLKIDERGLSSQNAGPRTENPEL